MVRTHFFPCRLPKAQANSLNQESGRIYTATMVEHFRIYRQTGHWLSGGAGERINDSLSTTFLHAHSRDAAQQGFYKACKTARACRKIGLVANYPPSWQDLPHDDLEEYGRAQTGECPVACAGAWT
jgi:hypothetical protein